MQENPHIITQKKQNIPHHMICVVSYCLQKIMKNGCDDVELLPFHHDLFTTKSNLLGSNRVNYDVPIYEIKNIKMDEFLAPFG